MVKDLRDLATRTWSWRYDLLAGLFLDRHQEERKEIPLSPITTPGVMIQHYEKSGIFLVPSAYHMGIEYMERESANQLFVEEFMEN